MRNQYHKPTTRYDADDTDAGAGYPDVWPPRAHTSSVRWRDTTTPATATSDGKYALHEGAPPKYRRASLYQQPPANKQAPRERKTTADLPRRRFHSLVFVGIGLIAMIVGYLAITSLFSFLVGVQEQWQYGYPRTFQCDAVVGQNDSPTHPSHFIVTNYQGQVEIVEFPGGDTTHAIIFTGLVLVGQDADQQPVTLTFQDVNHNGKPDMIVVAGNTRFIYLNKNGQFIKQN